MTEGADLSLTASLLGDKRVAAHFSPAAEIAAMLRFEAALAEAEAETGIIKPEAARAITAGVDGFVPDMEALRRAYRRDGVLVPDLLRQLRAAIGEPHGKALHLGATSQDVTDTGLMMRLRAVLEDCAVRLEKLIDTLDSLAKRDGEVALIAHTRMQAALPFTVADKIATWAAPLRSHKERIARLSRETLAIQLGGPIGTGGSFEGKWPEISHSLARRLDLAHAEPWHSDRSRIVDIAQGFALLSGTLGKIGQDAALLAQSEVGALVIAGGGASSAMPHKANPVAAELMVTLARLNAGHLGTLTQAVIHENERSGAAWTLEWAVLPQMAEAAGAGLEMAQTLVENAQFISSFTT